MGEIANLHRVASQLMQQARQEKEAGSPKAAEAIGLVAAVVELIHTQQMCERETNLLIKRIISFLDDNP